MWFKKGTLPKKITSYLLLLILLSGGLLRFYKLNWGENHFFNPDERNIVGVTLAISPPINFQFFTKGTFSYGSLVPYLVFWIDFLRRVLIPQIVIANQYTFLLIFIRAISAAFSTLSIFLAYLVGKKFWNKRVGLVAAALLAFSPGAIQAAHFGTFEATLSFLYLLALLVSLNLLQSQKIRHFYLTILIILTASAIKINSLILLPLAGLSLIFSQIKKPRFLIKVIIIGLSGLLLLASLTLFLSPYYLTKDFRGLLNYEQGLVRGKFDTFYTRSFFETRPVLFQLLKVFPFIANPFVITLLPILMVYYLYTLIVNSLKRRFKFQKSYPELMVLGFSIFLFLPNAFLFTKWTRYMVPTLPFISILTAFLIEKLINKKWQKPISLFLVTTGILWGLAFMSVYTHRDTRLTASKWIYQNIEEGSLIITETANVVDIPIALPTEIAPKGYQLKTYDFYALEDNPVIFSELITDLEKANYILIPSRRIFGGMGQFPKKYPMVHRYYQLLFSGQLGFKEIEKVTSYPRLLSFEFPDEQAEETWSVFDHPVVRIYKKNQPLTRERYEKLLKI